MKRLSGTDALLLATETPAWHQHIGALIVVEPATSDRFSFAQLRDDAAERLRGVPKFRWKLKEVPLHLDREVWVEDRDFNIGRHVRRIAVPPPGGRREVGELVGMLMSYQLDRRHPLWEMWYIDGVVGGQVAVFTKFHHCLMDGVSGTGLAEQLLDVEANPPPRQPSAVDEADGGPYEPSDLELVARALIPTIQTPRRLVQYLLRTAQRGVALLQQRARNPLAMGVAGPCFNGSVGPRRTIAFTSVGLEDVRALKDALGVKVNDIVLALVSGALRAHMLRHNEMPTKGSLSAGVPVSTRDADDTNPSNKVAVMMASLATDMDDPLERVQAIHRSTQSAKELFKAVRARKIQSVGEVAPPLLLGLASWAAWASNVSGHLPVVENLVVSNLRGPPFPLYMCGAKVSGIYPASILLLFGGLNITLMSYMDRVDVGLTADPDLLDDPWDIADAIPSALVELIDAAGLGKPTPVYDPFNR